MGKIFSHAPMKEKKNYEHDMVKDVILRSQSDTMTYIPSDHGGSLTSSMEKKDFNSELDTNFRRGAEGAVTCFFPTGYITFINQEFQRQLLMLLKGKKQRNIEKRKKERRKIKEGQ